jgi:hypothetical protein
MRVDQLRVHHIKDWIDSHSWRASYCRGAMTAVARSMNWALKKGHIEHNPIWQKLGKPPAGKREMVLSAQDFKRC